MRRLAPWLLPALAAAALAPLARGDDGDGRAFTAAGRVLLSPHWSRAFANRAIQAGPLQLLLYGTLGRSLTALAVVLGVAAALLVVAAVRAAGARYAGVAGLAAVATGTTRGVYEAGHPADALLPLLWVLAAADARRGRVLRAGLLVGLGAGFETWGILGVAVLVLAPRAVALAAAAAAALYAPFVLGGHFAAGDFAWAVTAHSLLGHVVAPGTAFGWPLRLLQGAAAAGAGGALAWRLRASEHVVWLVPLVVVAVRLLLDPLDSDYYFLGLATPALAGLALVASRRRRLSFTSGQSSSITAYQAESRF